MRKCLVTKTQWIQPQAGILGHREALPSENALFHQFVTETNEDDQLVTLAVVEYLGGGVETVPLTWIVLQPFQAEDTPAMAMQGVVDDLMHNLRGLMSEAYSTFRR